MWVKREKIWNKAVCLVSTMNSAGSLVKPSARIWSPAELGSLTASVGIIPLNSTSKGTPFFWCPFYFGSILYFYAYNYSINFKGVNFVDKKQSKQLSQEIPCTLHGSRVCPKPKECDGIHRLCSRWTGHSGR